jgi:hypothetical protein
MLLWVKAECKMELLLPLAEVAVVDNKVQPQVEDVLLYNYLEQN